MRFSFPFKVFSSEININSVSPFTVCCQHLNASRDYLTYCNHLTYSFIFGISFLDLLWESRRIMSLQYRKPQTPVTALSVALANVDRLLGLRVRFPPGARIFVSCEICVLFHVEACATGRSVVQGDPTECECVIFVMTCNSNSLRWLGRITVRKKEISIGYQTDIMIRHGSLPRSTKLYVSVCQ